MSTDLYKRTIAYDYGDEDRRKLMEKVWSPTPWMVDAFTDRINSERERDMMEWCRDEFGDECLRLAGRNGDWQRGSATIHGWNWFGFANEDLLKRFLARWHDEVWTAAEPHAGEPVNG